MGDLDDIECYREDDFLMSDPDTDEQQLSANSARNNVTITLSAIVCLMLFTKLL